MSTTAIRPDGAVTGTMTLAPELWAVCLVQPDDGGVHFRLVALFVEREVAEGCALGLRKGGVTAWVGRARFWPLATPEITFEPQPVLEVVRDPAAS